MGLFDLFRSKPQSMLDALQSLPEAQEQKDLFDAMSALCEDGTDADEIPSGTGKFGLTSTNPIPCKTVFGSTAYLSRLRAPDGTKVVHQRLGSTHSPVSPNPIDIYEIAHQTERALATLYISPYQRRNSEKAPLGFMLADSPSSQVFPTQEIVTEADGAVRYYSCGVLHRDDGPAIIETYPGYAGNERHRSWYRSGMLDRDDGPAIIGGRTTNGQYEWWRSGVRHSDDGPAVINLIDSDEFGRGPVYEWWRKGKRIKAQDGNGIIYHFNDDETLAWADLPDGGQVVERDGEYWIKYLDGTMSDESLRGDYDFVEWYDGHLETNDCAHELYHEPQETFDLYNPEQSQPDS